MPFKRTECYLDIECQLDEILQQVSSGVPEQKVVEDIGVALSDWVSFKLSRPEAVAALLPAVLAPMQSGTPMAARKPSRRRGMTCRKEVKIAP